MARRQANANKAKGKQLVRRHSKRLQKQRDLPALGQDLSQRELARNSCEEEGAWLTSSGSVSSLQDSREEPTKVECVFSDSCSSEDMLSIMQPQVVPSTSVAATGCHGNGLVLPLGWTVPDPPITNETIIANTDFTQTSAIARRRMSSKKVKRRREVCDSQCTDCSTPNSLPLSSTTSPEASGVANERISFAGFSTANTVADTSRVQSVTAVSSCAPVPPYLPHPPNVTVIGNSVLDCGSNIGAHSVSTLNGIMQQHNKMAAATTDYLPVAMSLSGLRVGGEVGPSAFENKARLNPATTDTNLSSSVGQHVGQLLPSSHIPSPEGTSHHATSSSSTSHVPVRPIALRTSSLQQQQQHSLMWPQHQLHHSQQKLLQFWQHQQAAAAATHTTGVLNGRVAAINGAPTNCTALPQQTLFSLADTSRGVITNPFSLPVVPGQQQQHQLLVPPHPTLSQPPQLCQNLVQVPLANTVLPGQAGGHILMCPSLYQSSHQYQQPAVGTALVQPTAPVSSTNGYGSLLVTDANPLFMSPLQQLAWVK